MNAIVPGIHLKDFSKVLLCFSKIGDELSIEPRKNKVLLSSLNISKSAFGLITLDCSKFFEKYEYLPYESCKTSRTIQTLKCKVQIRLLLAIFKYRNLESRDTKNISVQKCELKLVPPNNSEVECRFIIRFLCKHNVLKTYKITYEQSQAMYAVCDKSSCKNKWRINSRIFKEYLDHFSTRAEELTLMIQNDKLLLTSFTEGIIHNKEILKQPIQTAILLDKRDFEEIDFEEQTIITFPLKEFKAVVVLGDSMNTILNAYFNMGGEPILFEFEKDALSIRFILATTSENTQENASTFNWNKSINSNNFHQHSQNHTQINDIQFLKNENISNNETNNNMENYKNSTYNHKRSEDSIIENIPSTNNIVENNKNSEYEFRNTYFDSDDEVGPTQQSSIKGIFD
ncbi:hypothetical protein PMAC_000593 [Pneumocystis sp. 'macacae']|nr:hypothetical protein PMAC_000593 [Pneumocystis sp. 'macacae']